MWNIFFVFPCIVLFFFLSLFAGIFDDLVLIQALYILLISFLLLPLYYDHLPRKWDASRRVRTHIVFSLSMIMFLHAGHYFKMGVQKHHTYDYRYGHLSGPFRFMYSTFPVQFVIGGLYELSPLNYRIGLLQKEDVTRVDRIHKDVDSDFARTLLCYEKDRASCFLAIMKSSVALAPTGTAGTMSLYEKGANFLREEEILDPEKHDLHVSQSREFLNLIATLSTDPDTDVGHVVSGFPLETTRSDLVKLVKNEKKVRFHLSHLDPIVSQSRGRKLAGN
ncbi:MAG: hypothetical protein ACJ76H_16070 [Bacteriovoracaceae bacterium]